MITVLEGGITEVPGFKAAGVRAGIKKRGLDIMLLVSEDGPVTAAGAFTTNRVQGAPVTVTKEHLKKGKLGAIVANSGISNAYTGKRGLRDAYRMAQVAARLLKIRAANVGVASTGLIGAYMPMKRVEAGIKAAANELSNSREASLNAVKAIMTTDTIPKEVALRVDLDDGTTATIAGIAKGAGMISPKMKTATMLAFVVTDVSITSDAMKAMLQRAIDKSFNMVNIDNDTSTSDMVLVIANGRAKNRRITLDRMDRQFQAGFEHALTELAWMIAGDGEGATRLIEVQVSGARNVGEARMAARAVAGSNLVKSAVFGKDPNWGRVVAALGYSGAVFDSKDLSLELEGERGSVELVHRGKPAPKRALARGRDIMKSKEIEIIVNLGAGKASATAWGCDLTYDYVRINSRYTT
ncbi:MAG: bifunctional ornithine acetyltransferase/N-acetylglutamate synthase [Candidatus Hadarchaeota archaeon]